MSAAAMAIVFPAASAAKFSSRKRAAADSSSSSSSSSSEDAPDSKRAKPLDEEADKPSASEQKVFYREPRDLCDMELHTNGAVFHLHRYVILTQSEWFRAHKDQHNERVVVLNENVSPFKTVEDVLLFLDILYVPTLTWRELPFDDAIRLAYLLDHLGCADALRVLGEDMRWCRTDSNWKKLSVARCVEYGTRFKWDFPLIECYCRVSQEEAKIPHIALALAPLWASHAYKTNYN